MSQLPEKEITKTEPNNNGNDSSNIFEIVILSDLQQSSFVTWGTRLFNVEIR